MKARESGMPEEEYWNSFFDAAAVIEKMFGDEGSVVELGCGYGTFTFPAAERTSATIYAFDIEADLVERLTRSADAKGISNIVGEVRDFVADGTGLSPASQSHVMLYNLLHIENPEGLVTEAYRILKPERRLSIMHWRSDIPTPRGPSLDIRPTPEQCKALMEKGGFRNVKVIDLQDCCPYHFGVLGIR